MGKKNYQIESDFDDLRGNPDDAVDLEVDFSDTDNPIIKAALEEGSEDENWTPPKDDEDQDDGKKLDDEDDDDLEDLEDNDEGDEDDDEEDAGDDDEEDDDEDEDDGKYSKNVQKRIDRERNRRKAEREAADARISKLERENAVIRKENAVNAAKAKAESELAKLRKAKVDAKEEGDTEKEVEIDEKILDVKTELRVAESELKIAQESLDSDTNAVTDGTPPAGLKWLQKYPQFHTNQQFQKVVLTADRMVSDRGFDRNTDSYYEEIEKICAVQFPEIVKPAKKQTRKGKTQATARKKRRSAVGGTSKAGARKASRTRSGQIRLTKADQHQMEVFGMDPRNPDHIREWASNKTGS
jgi:hypothetical protein